MARYIINHTDEYDGETNKAEGKIFKNKDEIIEYLCIQLASISSDFVEIRKIK